MRRSLIFVSVLTLLVPRIPVSAQSESPFHSLAFTDNRQYVIHCAAGFECDVQLEAGERVNDGFNAHIDDWDPHIGYSGVDKVTPHLVLRPNVANLRTNIILTTTKRTYYILAMSTDRREPSYYTFTFADETLRELQRLSFASEAARRAAGEVPIPYATATPADVARLGSTCIDYDYSYVVDHNLQSDHPPHAKPSRETLPQNLIPRLVCTDGRHTYVEFPRQQEVPSDLPISLAVTSEGDTLIDYTYVATLNRFMIDGVYDSFALEIGSQDSPLRLRIYHAGRGNPPQNPRPIAIRPPADLDTIDSPAVPLATPLIKLEAPPTALPAPLPAATPAPVATTGVQSHAAALVVPAALEPTVPRDPIVSLDIGGFAPSVAAAPLVELEIGPPAAVAIASPQPELRRRILPTIVSIEVGDSARTQAQSGAPISNVVVGETDR